MNNITRMRLTRAKIRQTESSSTDTLRLPFKKEKSYTSLTSNNQLG